MSADRPPFITVVIPTRDADETIGAQLHALAHQDYAGIWEVVVADNGSRDQSAAVAGSFASSLPRLRIVDASSRSGVSHARNVGVRASEGSFVLICDADDVVAPGWLSAMASAASDDVVLAGVLARGATPDDPSQLIQPGADPRHGFLPSGPGGNCGFARRTFDRVGGFDEALAGGSDDVDFFWRAQLAGFALRPVEDAVIWNRVPREVGAVARQSYRFGRMHPKLYRKYRAFGMPRSTARDVAKRLAWLVLDVWCLAASQRLRRRWVRRGSFVAGRFVGSVRERVLYL